MWPNVKIKTTLTREFLGLEFPFLFKGSRFSHLLILQPTLLQFDHNSVFTTYQTLKWDEHSIIQSNGMYPLYRYIEIEIAIETERDRDIEYSVNSVSVFTK